MSYEIVQIAPVTRKMIAAGRITDPDSPRGRLLVAAARLFREKGYNRTTVRDLAAEVGILSGSIFHHFKNKDEILFGVMSEVVLTMDGVLKAALDEAKTIDDKVRALISCELHFIHGSTANATAVLVYEWRALSEDCQKQILQGRADYFQLWQDTLCQAEIDGRIAVEPEYLRQLLHGGIAWTSHWYKSDGKLSLDELTDRIMVLAIKSGADKIT